MYGTNFETCYGMRRGQCAPNHLYPPPDDAVHPQVIGDFGAQFFIHGAAYPTPELLMYFIRKFCGEYGSMWQKSKPILWQSPLYSVGNNSCVSWRLKSDGEKKRKEQTPSTHGIVNTTIP